MRFFFVFLLVTACHHEVKNDLNLDATEQDKTARTVEETRAETKKQDPVDVETKTTKSDNAVVVQQEDGSSEVLRVPQDRPLVLKKGAKVVDVVPIASTTEDRNEHIGAVVEEKAGTKKSTETDDKDKTAKVKEHDEETDDVGFSTKFYLLAGGILLAVSALGFVLLRSRRIRLLLGLPV